MCAVIWLKVYSLTPSTASISPLFRPVVTDGPVYGPSTTSVGHRPRTSDEETSGIVLLLRVDVNARRDFRKLAIEARALYDACCGHRVCIPSTSHIELRSCEWEVSEGMSFTSGFVLSQPSLNALEKIRMVDISRRFPLRDPCTKLQVAYRDGTCDLRFWPRWRTVLSATPRTMVPSY